MTLPEIPDDDTDFTPDLARKIIAKYQAILAMRNSDVDALVKVLHIFLPPGNEPMEDCLWGDQPDDATMNITLKYGKYREARKVLNGAVGNAGSGS